MKILTVAILLLAGALGESSNAAPVYPTHRTAKTRSVEEIFARTATSGINLPTEIVAKRKEIIAMYQQAGIDLSLDKSTLVSLLPKFWSSKTPAPLGGTYRLPYSIDAIFYQKIPPRSPRVALPARYIQSGHISTLGGTGSDEFGIGVVISGSQAPLRTIHLERANQYAHIGTCPEHHTNQSTSAQIHIRNSANSKLGGTGDGVPRNAFDRTVVWIDSIDHTTISTWGTIEDCGQLGDWSAMFIQKQEQLPNLGDRSGINAANKSDLVALLRPGEATDPVCPIAHALSGPVKNAWKAIVYPASNTDNSIDKNNRGLIGYGFLIQLDPSLDLRRLSLSLPARRILEAIQSYGWYMDDTGVRDFDIKGNFSAAEFKPFGGFEAVENEIYQVLKNRTLYVVAPPLQRSF
jgi:hypothetical protein